MTLIKQTNSAALNLITHVLYGRRCVTDVKSTKVIKVSPDDICEIPKDKPTTIIPLISAVKDGDWDNKTRLIENDVVYRGFVQRFVEGKPWKETVYHDFMNKRLEENSREWGKYHTIEDITKRYKSLDRLYENIKTNGYKSQRELEYSGDLVRFPSKDIHSIFLPPEIKEISVDIGRDGEFYWAAGMHRLCISKVLNVSKIPVRIRVRHKKWQEHRDNMANSSANRRQHPDL